MSMNGLGMFALGGSNNKLLEQLLQTPAIWEGQAALGTTGWGFSILSGRLEVPSMAKPRAGIDLRIQGQWRTDPDGLAEAALALAHWAKEVAEPWKLAQAGEAQAAAQIEALRNQLLGGQPS